METIYSLSGFDPAYLQNLADHLLPLLQRKKHPGWVHPEEVAENPELFVNAVTMLIRNGWFEDDLGHQRLEFGKANKLRYIPDNEMEMRYGSDYEKGTTISIWHQNPTKRLFGGDR